jgi:hypothetical protein
MQTPDIAMVNEACAAIARVARRSIEQHEARILELQKLLNLAEQIGATGDRAPNDPPLHHGGDILRTALDRAGREDAKNQLKVAG